MGLCMHHHRHSYSSGKKLYRSRDGMLFGVCRGIAEWKDLPVGWVRFFTILAFMSTGFFPVGLLYLLAGLFLPIEPRGYYRNFHSGYDDYDSQYDDRKYERRYDKEDDWDRRYYRRKKGDR